MQMTPFSDGTAGFVYTAIRPQPVALLCSAPANKCVFRVWREGAVSLERQGSATQLFYFAQRGHTCGEILHETSETRERFVLRLRLKSFFFEQTLHRCTAVFSLDKVGRTVKNRRQHFQACVVPDWRTALTDSRRGGHIKAFWIYYTFICWKALWRIWYTCSGKGCLSCAMPKNFHSLCVWEGF